jgi:nicotinamide-nucleotide amidase
MKNQIVQNIVDKLILSNSTISFAESCTGGKIASAFTSISGVSSVFNGSCVTYSNKIKHNWLGVSNEILDNYGAVSAECVSLMLKGIKNMADSDYAIAVSGIAGPTGGTEFKPVGTVYIGVLTPEDIFITKYLFLGDRDEVQQQATDMAIKMLSKKIL